MKTLKACQNGECSTSWDLMWQRLNTWSSEEIAGAHNDLCIDDVASMTYLGSSLTFKEYFNLTTRKMAKKIGFQEEYERNLHAKQNNDL
jgi:hypothetical protein